MKKFILSFVLLFIIFLFVAPGLCQAISLTNPTKVTVTGSGIKVGSDDLFGLIAKIFLGILGSIALLMFVYGGFMMLISGGDPGKITSGKQIVIWAVIGVMAVLGSYAVLNLIINAMTGKLNTGV